MMETKEKCAEKKPVARKGSPPGSVRRGVAIEVRSGKNIRVNAPRSKPLSNRELLQRCRS